MGKRTIEDWMESDDDYSLLGNRFARALKTREKRRHADEYRDRDWNHRPRKRIRPEPYRDRFS